MAKSFQDIVNQINNNRIRSWITANFAGDIEFTKAVKKLEEEVLKDQFDTVCEQYSNLKTAFDQINEDNKNFRDFFNSQKKDDEPEFIDDED